MPPTRVSMPPDAIRIEDEVWKEAFVRREPSRARAARRLRARDGGLTDTQPRPRTRPTRPVALPPRPVVSPPRPIAAAAPRPAAATAGRRIAGADARPVAAQTSAHGGTGLQGRRTVTIRGRGAERNLPWPDGTRRRPQRRAYERTGFKPDRVAMWAVLLGVLLVLVAILSAHG
jgi:hypothetical protein